MIHARICIESATPIVLWTQTALLSITPAVFTPNVLLTGDDTMPGSETRIQFDNDCHWKKGNADSHEIPTIFCICIGRLEGS